MLSALELIAEAISLIKPGMEIGQSLYDLFQRGKAIAEAPTLVTQAELAAFAAQLAAEKARLDANTAEIEKD